MRVAVLPDLHFGITKKSTVKEAVRKLKNSGLSLLVLVGDIGEPLTRFCEALDMFSALDMKIAVIAGNHDLWAKGEYSSLKLWEDLLPKETKKRGFIWLENEVVTMGSLAVIGSIAWYDYSGRPDYLSDKKDEAFFDTKGFFIKDGRFVNLPWDDIQFSYILRKDFIERIEQAQANPNVKEIMVCTHVPIFKEQKVDTQRWNKRVDAYYANFTLGRCVEQYSKVRWALAGHTHTPVRAYHTCPDVRMIYCSVVGSDYYCPDFEVIKIGE